MDERQRIVLIVDDEPGLVDVLEAYLTAEGLGVLRAADGRAAVDVALRDVPDLVLLDLNLPKLSGLDAFREIRAQLDIPVIMLTSRGSEVDRVVGLELGADDYVSKPYSPREVVARVKSVLRRRPARTVADAPHDVLRAAGVTIDRTTHDVVREGRPIKLTPTEFRLLEILVRHPDRVFTREHLIELIATDESDVFDRTLDRHIANLRAKLEIDAHNPRYVVTVYGIGYKFVATS